MIGRRGDTNLTKMKPSYSFKYIPVLLFFFCFGKNEAQTVRILIEVGELRHEFGDYSGAIDAYSLAIELNPTAFAYNSRGMSRAASGDDDGAISDFNRSIEMNDKFLAAYLNRAASKYNLEDYYGAIEDYGKVIGMDQQNAIAWYGRGISHIQIRYFIGACEDLNKAVELGLDFAGELIREHCR
jgi:tetratricopeptide (TPR) repeat protein